MDNVLQDLLENPTYQLIQPDYRLRTYEENWVSLAFEKGQHLDLSRMNLEVELSSAIVN